MDLSRYIGPWEKAVIDNNEEVYYRFYDQTFSGGSIELLLRVYPVLRHTPKGVWLDTYTGKKFVLRDAYKQFACPTLEKAMESYIARKKRQIAIYHARLETAERALRIAKLSEVIV